MPEVPMRLSEMAFRDFLPGDGQLTRGVSLASIADHPFEGLFVRYASGAFLPRHQHSAPVISVVIKGNLIGESGESWGPGSIVVCDGPYGPRSVTEEVVLLVLQRPGTKYVEFGDVAPSP